MKQHLLTLFLALAASVGTLFAQSGTCGDNLTWTLDTESGTLTISGTGAMTNYTYIGDGEYNTPWYSYLSFIKTVIIEDGVKSIGNYAFVVCESLTSVTIPNSVTSIGGAAFNACWNLTSIVIPNSVTSIGAYAFYGCSSLTSVTIPNSVTNIGAGAFGGCSSLTSIAIPNNVISVGNEAFKNCSSLTFITFPNSVTSIGEGAFYGCSSLTSVTIPNSVTSIGNSAFYGCRSLTSITIPNSVTSIEGKAFEGCSSLASVTIGNGVTSIGNYAFSHCSNLTSITIPNSVTSIGESAFSGCTGLTSITIPNSVTSIGDHAFRGCSSLTSITIPNSVTSIGESAFYGCSGLTSIVVENGNTMYDSRNKCNAIIETATNTLIAGCQTTTIPTSVTSIGNYAFSHCSNLTSITIPNSVTSIGESAFSGCTGLTSITIPNSVTNIQYAVFYFCSSLTSVTIPNSVTSIGESAFEDCSKLTSVTIPNSVTSIGESAFSGCTGLTSITIPNSVTTIGDLAFLDVLNIVYNGSAKGSKWGATTINGYMEGYLIYSDASRTNLLACSRVATGEIILPNSVTSIGGSAFSGCTGLTSITIPNSVTSIDVGAFYNCSGLTSITIPNSVTTIGNYAFSECRSLTAVHITDVAAWCKISFGDYANPLSYAHNLYLNGSLVTDLVIPNSVTSIGQSAFEYCTSLKSVTIPNSVTSIGICAFASCTGLTSVIIGNSVSYIGDAAFLKCSNLTSFSNYAIKPQKISDNVFTFSPCTLYVLPGSVDAYKAADGWRSFFHIAPITNNNTCGMCGQDLYWQLSNNGIFDRLIISGTGDMWDYSSDLVPWDDKCATINIVSLCEGVGSIGEMAFNNCSRLTSVTIPNSVTSIGRKAFANCSNLKDVIMESSTPPSFGYNAFPSTIIVYVPLGSLSAYKVTGWKIYNLRVFDASYTTSAVSPTSAAITFSASLKGENKNKYIVACGMEEGEEFSGNTAEYIGLEPGSQYKDVPFYIRTTKGDIQTVTASFKTTSLSLTTLQSKAVSDNTAILLAETNMSDAETSCGFEYKRNDAPEDMPATQVLCPIANGLMAGRLKGLKDDVYYKYRAFYKSAAGKMYYGDWQYIFTGDVAVEFDPVLYTYAAQFVSDRRATLKGYALAGSDDFTEQGFEYWAESRRTDAPARRAPQYAIGEKHTVKGTGISMRVTLEDLDEGTVYKYRTYAKVGGKTLYGAEMTFTTQGTYEDPIETDLDLIQDADAYEDSLTPTPRAPQARKYIRNGILYIEHNGITYTAQGHRID